MKFYKKFRFRVKLTTPKPNGVVFQKSKFYSLLSNLHVWNPSWLKILFLKVISPLSTPISNLPLDQYSAKFIARLLFQKIKSIWSISIFTPLNTYSNLFSPSVLEEVHYSLEQNNRSMYQKILIWIEPVESIKLSKGHLPKGLYFHEYFRKF